MEVYLLGFICSPFFQNHFCDGLMSWLKFSTIFPAFVRQLLQLYHQQMLGLSLLDLILAYYRLYKLEIAMVQGCFLVALRELYVFFSLRTSSITTICFRLCRYVAIQLYSTPVIPAAFNFDTSVWWQTVSKTFRKSRYTPRQSQ